MHPTVSPYSKFDSIVYPPFTSAPDFSLNTAGFLSMSGSDLDLLLVIQVLDKKEKKNILINMKNEYVHKRKSYLYLQESW